MSVEPDPSHWEVLSEREHADCRVYRVFEQRTRHLGDNREGTFYVMHCPDWIQAVPLTTDGQLILVNQYRFGSKQLSWEVPGGMMDPEDDSPESAAARELIEETGYRGNKTSYLGWSYPNPALQQNKTHFILIEGCEQVAGQDLDPNEELTIKTVPPREAIEMARRGEITHCICVNALFLLEKWLAERG